MAGLERRVAQLESAIHPVETVVVSTGISDECTETYLSACGLKGPVRDDLESALKRMETQLGFKPNIVMLVSPYEGL